MGYKTIKTFDLNNARVLVRVDLNVPLKNSFVRDNTRLKKIKPNIDKILALGGKPILIGHIGRPKGCFEPELSVKNIVSELECVLQKKVVFCEKLIGPIAINASKAVDTDTILLLENTRFYGGEMENEAHFSKSLSKLGDVFCNDAFSVSHRAHASTVGVTKFLPSFAGSHIIEEIEALELCLSKPKKPLTAVIGGSKVSSKIKLLKNLVRKVDNIIIGGGMANTFLLANGYEIGQSKCEPSLIQTAREIVEAASMFGCEIHLPIDLITSTSIDEVSNIKSRDIDKCQSDEMIFDCGDRSIELYSKIISGSKTVVWNGPLGVFEVTPFDNGTKKICQLISSQTSLNKITSIVGGGDTVAALNLFGFMNNFSYVSTAGGAFLEWLEGKKLPGIEVLKR